MTSRAWTLPNRPLQRTAGSVAPLPLPAAAERLYRWPDTMSSRKRWTLEKREEELRRALTSDARQEAIARAAEHVREAQLAILKKAESGVAPTESRSETRERARRNIQRERAKWLDATIAEIISWVHQKRSSSRAVSRPTGR